MTTSTLTENPKENLVLVDLEMLQGRWISVSGRREAELLFAGYHFTVRFLDGDLYMGKFALNPGNRPKIMEMQIDEGPDNHQGKVARCLRSGGGRPRRYCADLEAGRTAGELPCHSGSALPDAAVSAGTSATKRLTSRSLIDRFAFAASANRSIKSINTLELPGLALIAPPIQETMFAACCKVKVPSKPL